MSETLELVRVEDVPAGTGTEVVAAGRIFAVFNVDGNFHVLDGICPHAGGPLGKGMLRNRIVTCPWHGWQFDVISGKHCLNAQLCQPSYACRIVDDHVVIDLPQAS